MDCRRFSKLCRILVLFAFCGTTPSLAQERETSREPKPNPEIIKKTIQELERTQNELEAERARVEADMRRALAELRGKPGPQNLAAESQMLHEQLEKARAQLAQWAAIQQKASAAPLPDNAQTRVFSLRDLPASSVANTIEKIVGGQAVRMAVDERSNSIIVSGDEKVMQLVEKLVMQLGETSSRRENRPAETLQLRIVWLLDGLEDEGKEPTDKFISADVRNALEQLGFENPRVVSQQVNTVTVSHDDEGLYRFAIPVLINNQLWQFDGSGTIRSMANDRFALKFELQIHYVKGGPHHSQLGGSIFTPLGHYTVMGTNTFVASSAPAIDPNNVASGGEQAQQHLSAFVVFLDRAREFPAAGAPSHHQSDERP